MSVLESLPFAPAQRTDSIDRLHVLDAYTSFTLHHNVISFGKQTLWWGPGADAPFLASNNAEPLAMLRISRASPFVLPAVFRRIAPIRAEIFWGQLGGQQFVALIDAIGMRKVVSASLHPHPFVQGLKFSFKPTRNLQFGFGVTAILSGPGFPLTLHSLLRSYAPNGTPWPDTADDPGERRSAFDFSYRVPGLRNWLTFYGDSFTEDEFTPIYPSRANRRSGPDSISPAAETVARRFTGGRHLRGHTPPGRYGRNVFQRPLFKRLRELWSDHRQRRRTGGVRHRCLDDVPL